VTGFLEAIVSEVGRSVDHPGYLSGLTAEPRSTRPSLRAAVTSAPDRWAILLERKRVSPGAADPDLPEMPLEAFVEVAGAVGATGLSCLATGPRFRGSPQEVAALARSTSLPVLFKDFVVRPVQVEAARRSGAAALLLIARLEREGRIDARLNDLSTQAHAAGLEVLLELHDPRDLPVADRVPADLYGINVRDLDTLDLRPDTARATFRASAHLRPRLGLSGVAGPPEASRFRSWGADGILIGTGFARAENPRQFVSALRAPGARGESP
jgi:indole-3-glycerol phosphate synthase